MPYMYILRCPDGTLFTGTTWNLSHRLAQNGSEDADGLSTGTAWRRQARLVYVEWFERIDEAFYRERQVHGWPRWQKDRLIAQGRNVAEGRSVAEGQAGWGWVDLG